MEWDLREWLPGIDIAISIEPREFLERMAVIGEQSGQFTVERHYDAIKNGELDIINFQYLGDTAHTGVGGQLIAREDRPGRILVGMQSIGIQTRLRAPLTTKHWRRNCAPCSESTTELSPRVIVSEYTAARRVRPAFLQ